ncbi:MAG: metal ABC transporter substrate-binding protein [Candidatus Thorarchaeota archaeon]|jgi:ABC-type Zn uptake system ZnuABC Zn-binding protein ZnuA
MRAASVVIVGLLLFSIGVIGLVPIVDAQTEPILQVAVSVAPLGGIVDIVGQSYVQTDVLLPEGVEPHAAQLPQSAIDAASSADLLVLTGHFPWEEDLVNQSATPYIDLHDYEEFGLELSPIPGGHVEQEPGHEHEDGNLHSYWLLPMNAVAIANATRDVFDSLAPSYSDYWQSSFEQFVEEVNGFEGVVEEFDLEYQFSDLTTIVVFPAEAYIAEAFGIDVKAVLQEGENVFISGAELIDVQTALVNGSIDLIIGSDIARLQAGGEFAIQLAEDTGSRVIWWRAIFFSELSDYLSLMAYNLGILVASLDATNPSNAGNTTNYLLIGISGFLAVVVLVETVLLFQRIRKEE